jgi:hypothetical protein
MNLPPAVTVHGLAGARAALAAAGPRGVLLLSAPGAGAFAGAAWFLGMVAAATRADVQHQAAIDCADAAGSALAALRAGARLVVLHGDCPSFIEVAAAAAACGARLLPERPASLDLGRLDLRRRADLATLSAWLALEAPQPRDTSAPA